MHFSEQLCGKHTVGQKQQRLIELALTLLVSLLPSSILPFLPKPVPGSNTHNLSYRASGVDLLCHFSDTKSAEGRLSVSVMAHSWIPIKWQPPRRELSLFYELRWASSPALVSHGHWHVTGSLGRLTLGPCSLSHGQCHMEAGKYVMWCSLDKGCLPTFRRDWGSCFTTEQGKVKTFGSWPCLSTRISLAKSCKVFSSVFISNVALHRNHRAKDKKTNPNKQLGLKITLRFMNLKLSSQIQNGCPERGRRQPLLREGSMDGWGQAWGMLGEIEIHSLAAS